jgi:protein-disulfide isomerase
MKAFIDKVFKKRKQDAEQSEEPIKTENKATEAMVESIIEEVKEVIKKEVKEVIKKEVIKEEVVSYPKPKHFPDCNCFKCERWKQQNA